MKYSNEDIQHNERLSIRNGASSTIANSFYMNFIPLFAISVLNASNQQVGWLSSLPPLMTMLVMIPGAIWINRLETKKMFTAMSVFISRVFLILLVMLPFLNSNKSWLLIGIIALMNIPIASAALSWQSFIGDLIPLNRRGAFFGERNRVLTLVGLITTLGTGLLLNLFDKTSAIPYQIIFAFAFLFGMLEVYYLIKHKEVKKVKNPDESQVKFIKTSMQMVKNKAFLTFLTCAIIFNFGWQMAWPLFNIYQISDAHASAIWVSLFTVANQVSQMISFRWWGRKADKWGNSVMLFVAAAGMATAPTLTILSTNLIYLTVVNLFTGVFVAGTVMLLFNKLLEVSPENLRTDYIANYNMIIAGVGFVSPQVGIFLLEHWNIHIAMNISSVIRLIGSLSFLFAVLYIEQAFPKKKKVEVVVK